MAWMQLSRNWQEIHAVMLLVSNLTLPNPQCPIYVILVFNFFVNGLLLRFVALWREYILVYLV